MSEFGDWPPELLARVIKAMAPEAVCRTCGEPRRRVVTETRRFVVDERRLLAEEIASKRQAAGLRHVDMVGWFSWFKPGESARVQISSWERGVNVPTPQVWDILKTRLGVDPSFDSLVYGERTWQRTENLAEYVPHGDPSRQNAEAYAQATMGQNPSAQAMPRGRATKLPQDAGFSDCGHNDWRPGAVLDPFGTGGTSKVAETLGRDSIEIQP